MAGHVRKRWESFLLWDGKQLPLDGIRAPTYASIMPKQVRRVVKIGYRLTRSEAASLRKCCQRDESLHEAARRLMLDQVAPSMTAHIRYLSLNESRAEFPDSLSEGPTDGK
jgi:hypothetical protein